MIAINFVMVIFLRMLYKHAGPQELIFSCGVSINTSPLQGAKYALHDDSSKQPLI